MAKSFAELVVEAARQEAEDAPGDRLATARRIHASLERRRRVRTRGIKVIAAITASLFGSTAFAWYAGWSLPWIAPRTPTELPAMTEPVHRAPRPSSRPPAPAMAEPAIVTAPDTPARNGVTPAGSKPPLVTGPAPEVAAPPAPARSAVSLTNGHTSPVARAEPPRSAPPRTHPALVERSAIVPPTAPGASDTAWPVGGASVRPGPAAPRIDLGHSDAGDAARGDSVAGASGNSAELAAYRRAHDAHFRGADPAAALAAWDAYLASYPDGALALEARYDRALLLIKLERWHEADAALRPFAAAPAGSYRQAEAARLLDAIAGRSR